jgi:hypothetical protein
MVLLIGTLVQERLVDLKKFVGFDNKNGGGVVVDYCRDWTASVYPDLKWRTASSVLEMVEAPLYGIIESTRKGSSVMKPTKRIGIIKE